MLFRRGKLTKREKDYLKYRWEFLRRNEEYCKGYKLIAKKLKTGDLLRLAPDAVPKWVFEFLVKWDMVNLIPPQLSFEEMVAIDKKWNTLFFDYLVSSCSAIEVEDDPKLLEGDDLYVKAVMVNICVNMKMTKEKIMDEFAMLVDRWQDELKVLQTTFPKSEPEIRLQVEQYKKYLEVYDEHKNGLTVDQLAKKYYSGYIESSGKEYARRRVNRDIESCQKLIDGGFLQIR